MREAVLLLLAWSSCVIGMAWLALALGVHWRQVRSGEPPAQLLRGLGTFALLASLLLCLTADHASMAALVWIMALASAALTVAFTLTWRPLVLAPLVMWVKVG